MHNPYPSTIATINSAHSLQTLPTQATTMCASYTVPSPRETKRRRNNWFNSCCGIFEDYEPVIYYPETYSTSPAIVRGMVTYPSPAIVRGMVTYPSPAIARAEDRQPRRNNWLNSCCGILEDYDPVIYHPEMYSASPANMQGVGTEEDTHVSGSLWRKNILMGGKCKMPDYSGVIIYDTAGKLVGNSKPALLALPWK